jgi:hypothetical protein
VPCRTLLGAVPAPGLQEAISRNRTKAFRPTCGELEGRILLSLPSLHPTVPAISIAEAVPAASRSLKLDGVSPYAFAIHRGSPPGYPIDYILLGGSSQRLTANGVKVPNGAFISVSGNPVALYEPTYLAFFGESTMSLATRKGNLTLHLTPVTPGGHVLRFSVASGTGVFANSQGTGTVTFGLFDKSYYRATSHSEG